MSTRLWQLEGDLRQAFENYCGGMVSGPWDRLIVELACAIHAGELTMTNGARIDLLLRRTHGDNDACCQCDVCECPYPDQAHP